VIWQAGISISMNKQDLTRWFADFCPSIEIDNGKIYLDNDHLLVYLEPKDGMITLGSEIHGARMTYIVGKYDYEMVDKLVAIWSEFMDLNNDAPRTTNTFLPSI
jgi:hypothetical protein